MRALLVACLLGLLGAPASAQTIWSRPYEPNQFAVEALVPNVEEDAALLSGATFFNGTVSLSSTLELAAELPVARYGAASNGVSSTTAVGNPYVGLGFSSTSSPLLFELGARLPTARSNAATRIGRAVDAGRTSAFRPEEFALSGLLNGRVPFGRNSTVRLRTGVAFASQSRPSGTRRDWRLHYDAQLWREGDRLITGISLTGRTSLTNGRGNQNHAVLSVMGNWDRVQPGIIAGATLNDVVRGEPVSFFGGLTLSITYLR